MAQSKSKTPTEYTHEQLKERAYTILCDRFHLGWVYPEVGTAGGYFDVLGKRPHHRHIVGVECKASRADFLSDIRSDKWKNYLPYCNELWFYVNRGVCEAGEAPGDVGLMFAARSDHILRRTVKKAGTRRIHHLKYIEVVEALFGISHYRKFPHVYWKGRDERRETSYWKKRC